MIIPLYTTPNKSKKQNSIAEYCKNLVQSDKTLEDYSILVDRFLALDKCRRLHELIIQKLTEQICDIAQEMAAIEAEYPGHTAVIWEFTRQDKDG